jgi:hypothetical protein
MPIVLDGFEEIEGRLPDSKASGYPSIMEKKIGQAGYMIRLPADSGFSQYRARK